MNKEDQEHVINCLESIAKLAGENTTDHRVLATHTMAILNTLNLLFDKEGLPPVKKLFGIK
jgi:hypothetical protein